MYCEIAWELRRGRAKASAFPGYSWELEKNKLGDWEDIKHELEWLENPNYYVVVQQILQRPLTLDSTDMGKFPHILNADNGKSQKF